MDEEPDTVEIRFDDVVNARSVYDKSVTPVMGMLFGDWYVNEMTSITAGGLVENAADLPPSSRMMVGHNPSGCALIWGLEFWDARRIALAMADAEPDVSAGAGPECEAIIASALMDHYVFPIAGWSV